MRPSSIIDTHCDTLTRLAGKTNDYSLNTLNMPGFDLSLDSISVDVRWAQFYAVFLPDRLSGSEAADYFDRNYQNFLRQMKLYGDRVCFCLSIEDMEKAWRGQKIAAFLSIENASALGGDLSRVKLFHDQGVRLMSLTWNGENELASGHDTNHGMSDFGILAVKEMEKEGIIADVSHLNDAGFLDFLSVSTRPFMASHSNARSICSHVRNLTDAQICEMLRRDCLISLNYHAAFLNDDPLKAGPEDLYRHMMHFLELGAEKNLGLGSDYDGCDLPAFLKTPDKVFRYAEYLSARGVSDDTILDIYYRNSLNFFKKNLR